MFSLSMENTNETTKYVEIVENDEVPYKVQVLKKIIKEMVSKY